MNIEIANRLVKMRKAHGYSQEELAEKLGISRQAVSKWERAESSPDTDNLIMLSKLYGVSLDDLLATEDEIPMPGVDEFGASPEDEQTKRPKDSVHISWKDGINVNDEDGSRVHVGWDGIHVSDKNEGEGVEVSRDDLNDPYLGDIEIDADGVIFDENGERTHHAWNGEKEGKKRFVHKVFNDNTGKWRTTVITEDGRKVVIETKKELDEAEILGDAKIFSGSEKRKKSVLLGFPYALLVTGAFLLLGFLKNWWHPAWLLFLTVPIYYAVVSGIRNNKFNVFDVIVPVAVTAAYLALGFTTGLWHPLWLIFFTVPLYYAVSIAVRSHSGKKEAVTGIYALLTVAAYIALGFVFGGKAWTVGWLLFLTIPMFGSIAASIRKRRGRRWIRKFPWELLAVLAYLFVGLMFRIWHPTWVVFLLIPVWRWLVNVIGGRKSDSEIHIDDDDDDDDDD